MCKESRCGVDLEYDSEFLNQIDVMGLLGANSNTTTFMSVRKIKINKTNCSVAVAVHSDVYAEAARDAIISQRL